MNLFTYNIKMFKMKRLLFTLLMMCGIAYAQPGVDSTQTLPNPTPMTAKEYKFKYIQALNTISARSKFFGYDSAFFKNGIYTDITPPADDSSDLVPNTDWVMRQLAAYTPGGGGAEDTLILGRGIARDSLAHTKNRIYLDSSIYRVVQLNDSTLEFAHYDGRLDTVTIVGSGGGGGGTPGIDDVLAQAQVLTANRSIDMGGGSTLLQIYGNGFPNIVAEFTADGALISSANG